MREILFRGKPLGNLHGKFIYGSLGVIDTDLCAIYHCFEFNDDEMLLVDPETVGQYTGLTDKNGKKIFEGDIVKYKNSSPCQIAYIDSQFVMMWKNFYRNFEQVYDDEIEVIGNIYDNPEMLEVENARHTI